MSNNAPAAIDRTTATHAELALQFTSPRAPDVAAPLTPDVALAPAEVVNGADGETETGFPPESTTFDALTENARM